MKPIDIFYDNVYLLGTLCEVGATSLESLDYVKPTGEPLLDQILADCKQAFGGAIGFDDVFAKQGDNQKKYPELLIFYSYLHIALDLFTGSFMISEKPALLYAIVTKGDLHNHELQRMYAQQELSNFSQEHALQKYFITIEPTLAEAVQTSLAAPLAGEQLFPNVQLETAMVDTAISEKLRVLCEMTGINDGSTKFVNQLRWFKAVLNSKST